MPLVPPTVDDLAGYTGLDSSEHGLENALAVAVALVDGFLVDAYREVPQPVYTNEVLRTAHAVYKQSETVSGSTQIVELGQVTTTRFNSDPLTASLPTLRKYVLGL